MQSSFKQVIESSSGLNERISSKRARAAVSSTSATSQAASEMMDKMVREYRRAFIFLGLINKRGPLGRPKSLSASGSRYLASDPPLSKYLGYSGRPLALKPDFERQIYDSKKSDFKIELGAFNLIVLTARRRECIYQVGLHIF